MAEAKRLSLDVEPVSGAEVEALIREVYASAPEALKLAPTPCARSKLGWAAFAKAMADPFADLLSTLGGFVESDPPGFNPSSALGDVRRSVSRDRNCGDSQREVQSMEKQLNLPGAFLMRSSCSIRAAQALGSSPLRRQSTVV